MATKKMVVLGAGMVGGAMARDLAADRKWEVTLVDRSPEVLSRFEEVDGLSTRAADLGDPGTLDALLAAHDLAIGAVPGHMGMALLERVAALGTDLVDISFAPEDPWHLDGVARENDAMIVVDAGIAPGLSNMLIGRAEADLDEVDRAACYVGGVPVEKSPPWDYAAPFSPIDVVEEYVRPARMRDDGAEVTRPALSRPERIDFPGVGELEAFETDGLRTLLRTSRARTLVEKTMRYPGHRDRIAALRDAGFFGTDPVELPDGSSVRPLDLAVALLLPAWRLEPGRRDLLAMRVEVEGSRDGRSARRAWEVLDHYDTETATTAMSRTTGYTATAVARRVAEGWRRPGIVPPEEIGADAVALERILADLEARGIRVREA